MPLKACRPPWISSSTDGAGRIQLEGAFGGTYLAGRRVESREMTYLEELNTLRSLNSAASAEALRHLESTCPARLRPWPRGMPASLAPKLIVIGVSPGNSPMPGDTGDGSGYVSEPSVRIQHNSNFYYPDGTRYWEKVRRLVSGFFAREGSLSNLNDQLSLCSHFNLGTKRAGQGTLDAVEPDVIAWVSSLLNNVHKPDLVVLLGLGGILRQAPPRIWWNGRSGLKIEWRRPDREWPLDGYNYRFREWVTDNALGHSLKLVIWPNHPSKHPFVDNAIWERSIRDYLGR